MIFTVIDSKLAMVQNAGINLKDQRLGWGSGEEVVYITGGTGGVEADVRGAFAPL